MRWQPWTQQHSFISIDGTAGALTPTDWTNVDPIPHALSLDPAGHFLFVAGLETGNLIGFSVEQRTGALTRLETYPVGATTMWVLIANMEE